MFAIQ
jgi:hypothetical protein